MLAFLNISQDYIFPRIVDQYPCLSHNQKLISQMLGLYAKKIPNNPEYLEKLRNNYESSAQYLSLWQSESLSPEFILEPAMEIIDHSTTSLSHLDFNPCSFMDTLSMYRALAQLWTAFISIKVTNDDMSYKAYDKWIKSSKKQIKNSRSTFTENNVPKDYSASKETKANPKSTKQNSASISNRGKVWIIFFIFIALAAIGYFYFKTGTYQKFPSPYAKEENANPTEDTTLTPLMNIQMIEKDNSYYLISQINKMEVKLDQEAKEVMDSMYSQNSMIVYPDSLDKLAILTQINRLDPSVFPRIEGDENELEMIENRYPESIFLFTKTPIGDKTVISLKKI